MNSALSDHLTNCTFSDHTCEDSSRRLEWDHRAGGDEERARRLSSSVTISMEVTVPTAAITQDDGGSTDVLSHVTSVVSAAQSSGALASAVQSYALAANVSAVASVTVDSIEVATFTPTPAPSAVPTPIPLPAPTTPPTPAPVAAGAALTTTPAPTPPPSAAPTPTETNMVLGAARSVAVPKALATVALLVGAVLVLA